MSRARRSLKDLLALLLLTLCPMQAIAQDDEWVRVDVFDGRASVEVPKSYKRADAEKLDDQKRTFSGRDGFFIRGMRAAMAQAFNERTGWLWQPPPYAFGSRNSKAHFWVMEVSHRDDREDQFGNFCPEERSFIRRNGGFHYVYQDRSRSMTFCGGAMGAAAFFVCRRVVERRVCVFGMDYIEMLRLSRSSRPNEADHSSAEKTWGVIRGAANGPVIERVLESFRYK